MTNLRLELSSIYFFWFHHLFINVFSLKNRKNHFSTIDQGFQISEKSLEALVRFTSSPRTFSSFHRSFLVSKSKIPKKIVSDFNLLTFLSLDSTSTCHYSNLKIKFEELSINFVWYVKSCIRRPRFHAYQPHSRHPLGCLLLGSFMANLATSPLS